MPPTWFESGLVHGVGYQFSDAAHGGLDLLGNSALMFTLIFPLAKLGF